MPLPTLLQRGRIKTQPWMSEFEINKIKTSVTKDYVLDWFNKRIPTTRGGIPMIKATSVGDRILILKSGTGSGKSTTMPPEIYLKFYKSIKKNIKPSRGQTKKGRYRTYLGTIPTVYIKICKIW